MLLEIQLEKQILQYYKPKKKILYKSKSPITHAERHYTKAHLMSLFAIEAELDLFEILKRKYKQHAKLLGGTEYADILGKDCAFNVKVISECRTSLNLFLKGTLEKIENENLNYYFIVLHYGLNNNLNAIEIQDVYVISYKDLKPYIKEYNNKAFIGFNDLRYCIYIRDLQNKTIFKHRQYFTNRKKPTCESISSLSFSELDFEKFTTISILKLLSIKYAHLSILEVKEKILNIYSTLEPKKKNTLVQQLKKLY